MWYFGTKNGIENEAISGQRALKDRNIRMVFRLISQNRGISRIELASMTALTPTTISMLVEELIRIGLVREAGENGSGALGRRRIMLEVDPDGRRIPVFWFRSKGIEYRLFDLGYRIIESGYLEYPAELMPIRCATQQIAYREVDGNVYVQMILRLIREQSRMFDGEIVEALCIVFPGTFSWKDESFSSSVLQVKGSTCFLRQLQQSLDNLPLLVGNESACYAYEYSCNRTEAPVNTVFLNIDEGVGSGIIIDDNVFTGDSNLAGEFGHISIDMNGRRCLCGNRGCVERYISKSAITERVCTAIRNGAKTDLSLENGEPSWDTLCLAYEKGEILMTELMEQIAKELVYAISNLSSAIDIHRYVIGGDIQKMGLDFLNKLRMEAHENGFHKVMRQIKFEYAGVRNNAACYGIVRQLQNKYIKIPA